MHKLLIFIFFAGCLISCSPLEKTATRTFDRSLLVVDLEKDIEGDWDKVCFLPPYTNNDLAREVLKIEFDVESNSRVSVLDSITLVVLIKQNAVLEYFETPRKNMDFASLKARCFLKSAAKFKVVKDKHGWPHMQSIKQTKSASL